MKILYLGLPLGAWVLGTRGLTPAVVVLSGQDPGKRRLLRHPNFKNTLILDRPSLIDPDTQTTLLSARADLVVSFFYSRKIPAALYGPAPQGGIGVHPSLLPRWRGPDPVFWTLYHGDTRTGVTVHRLADAFDTGDMLAQKQIAVTQPTNAYRLNKTLEHFGLHLLVDMVDKIKRGVTLHATPQNEADATHAPMPSDRELEINWKQSSNMVLQHIRAASPFPGAHTCMGEHIVEVIDATHDNAPPRLTFHPGESFISPRGLHVRTLDGFVILTRVRIEDGTLVIGKNISQLM